MPDLNRVGADWLVEEVTEMTDHIEHVSPSVFNEQNRYLPESVTSIPGYLRYSVNPFMREIVDCFDVASPVREVNLKKGVQITYSTLLESGTFYYMAHVKTLPIMYMTADKELALARIENNFLVMLNQSGFSDIIRSSDTHNSRKTGKTKDHLQGEGGWVLYPFGARNADKMRSYSICVLMKDEIDAWPDTVGKDGDPDKLSDARCKGYWERRKIFRGSTPLLAATSKIQKQYLRGDQREYRVLCRHCGYPQKLRWSGVNKETGHEFGMKWELDKGVLVPESVRYLCANCGGEHFEHDKVRLFSETHGAHWHPTARPVEPGIRSYHLPAMYSPIGMAPWYSQVSDYLEAFDPEARKVRDIGKYQVFYNNILAEPFTIQGAKIRFTSVSGHRRACYRLGEIPNSYAAQHCGSPILLLMCQVDVHKRNLAVSVKGWTRDARCFVITYERFEAPEGTPDCDELSSPVWQQLRDLIEEKEFTADDGKKYRIAHTWIDAGYANATVVTFCSDYAAGVTPILGRDRPAKNQSIKEFSPFTTQAGLQGFKIVVDHYKDRLAPVLRREWVEESGEQKPYHFNAPVDISDGQLKELTVETRRERKDEQGRVTYFWHRPGNAKNELWDLLVYSSAGVEILAWQICIQHFELETIDWAVFWEYLEDSKLYFTE